MDYKISKFPYKKLRHLAAFPFIWGVSVPLVLMDFSLEIYHHVAFPLYGIPLVKRGNYIRLDRQKLFYLPLHDKINCSYCGYANGFAAYMVRIAGDTERYWCGIKHKEGDGYMPEPHQENFLPYGDKQAYEEFISKK